MGMMDNSAKSRADDPWRGPVTAATVGGEAREPGAVWCCVVMYALYYAALYRALLRFDVQGREYRTDFNI